MRGTGGSDSASAWVSSSTASTSSHRQATRLLSRSVTLAPTCSFSSSMYACSLVLMEFKTVFVCSDKLLKLMWV